jgi:hypothetical protein
MYAESARADPDYIILRRKRQADRLSTGMGKIYPFQSENYATDSPSEKDNRQFRSWMSSTTIRARISG